MALPPYLFKAQLMASTLMVVAAIASLAVVLLDREVALAASVLGEPFPDWFFAKAGRAWLVFQAMVVIVGVAVGLILRLFSLVAIDLTRQDASLGWRSPRKVVCPNCAYHKVWEGNSISSGDSHDWYFGLPLWLQIPCCGKVLWAHNKYHLKFLEDYVGSVLRERHPNKNKTLASRLPTWIKEAKNREEILKCIRKLKEKDE